MRSSETGERSGVGDRARIHNPTFVVRVRSACSMVLKRLEDLNFNALDSSMLRGLQGVNPLSFQVKLLWAALTGKVRPV